MKKNSLITLIALATITLGATSLSALAQEETQPLSPEAQAQSYCNSFADEHEQAQKENTEGEADRAVIFDECMSAQGLETDAEASVDIAPDSETFDAPSADESNIVE